MPPVSDERVTRGMEHQLAERRRRLARDDGALGWKLGFGTAPAMEKLGIDAPLVGFLLESGRLESGAIVDISNWGNPRLEPEIVARVGEDRQVRQAQRGDGLDQGAVRRLDVGRVGLGRALDVVGR